jgi:hypothetical protein
VEAGHSAMQSVSLRQIPAAANTPSGGNPATMALMPSSIFLISGFLAMLSHEDGKRSRDALVGHQTPKFGRISFGIQSKKIKMNLIIFWTSFSGRAVIRDPEQGPIYYCTITIKSAGGVTRDSKYQFDSSTTSKFCVTTEKKSTISTKIWGKLSFFMLTRRF